MIREPYRRRPGKLARKWGDEAHRAAIWIAVGKWLAEQGKPSFAISELLAASRRALAGRPRKFVAGFGQHLATALSLRDDWSQAGAPHYRHGVYMITKHMNELNRKSIVLT